MDPESGKGVLKGSASGRGVSVPLGEGDPSSWVLTTRKRASAPQDDEEGESENLPRDVVGSYSPSGSSIPPAKLTRIDMGKLKQLQDEEEEPSAEELEAIEAARGDMMDESANGSRSGEQQYTTRVSSSKPSVSKEEIVYPRGKFQIDQVTWVIDGASGMRASQGVVPWRTVQENSKKAIWKDAANQAVQFPDLVFSLGYFPVVKADGSVFWGIIVFSDHSMKNQHGESFVYQKLDGTPFYVHQNTSQDCVGQLTSIYNGTVALANKNLNSLVESRPYFTILGADYAQSAFRYDIASIDGPSAGLAIYMALMNQPATCWYTGCFDGGLNPGDIGFVSHKVAGAHAFGQNLIVQGAITERTQKGLIANGYGSPLNFIDLAIGAPNAGTYFCVTNAIEATAFGRMLHVSTSVTANKAKNRETSEKDLLTAQEKGRQVVQTIKQGTTEINFDLNDFMSDGVINPHAIKKFLDARPNVATMSRDALLTACYVSNAAFKGVAIYSGNYPVTIANVGGKYVFRPTLNAEAKQKSMFTPRVAKLKTVAALLAAMSMPKSTGPKAPNLVKFLVNSKKVGKIDPKLLLDV